MASKKLKEDEKNEKIIRGLAKLPANRRCINCNSQGTQYVCTNFATFICIHCSGIHREFTHRVKSISMAKFTPQEITSLQEGGNDRAKGIYFKDWDFERYTLPDNSDVDKLRDFIKHVYVHRRFSGDKNIDKPPVIKSEKEELSIQERSRGAPLKGEPSAAKKTNDDKNSDDRQNIVVPPVKQVLQVVLPAVRLPEPPKLNKPGTPKPNPAPIQSTTSTLNNSNNNNNNNNKDSGTQIVPEEVKKPTASVSLIDFDSDPEPVTKQQTATLASQNKDTGWASFDTQKPPHTSTPSILESSLVHRSSPGPGPAINNNPQLNRPVVVGSVNQIWGQIQANAPNIRTTGIVSNQTNQGSQHLMHEPGPQHQTHVSFSSPNSRNTLPQDLFSMVYGAPVPGWQGAPRVMQYATPPPNHAYYQPVRSSNPFDNFTEPKLAHANTFPSMTSLQGALPNLSYSNPNPNPNPNANPNFNPNLLSRASSMVPYGSQWAPQPMHPSLYQGQMHTVNMPQQIPNNVIYNGNQVMGGYGTSRNPNSFSQAGGNPFA